MCIITQKKSTNSYTLLYIEDYTSQMHLYNNISD